MSVFSSHSPVDYRVRPRYLSLCKILDYRGSRMCMAELLGRAAKTKMALSLRKSAQVTGLLSSVLLLSLPELAGLLSHMGPTLLMLTLQDCESLLSLLNQDCWAWRHSALEITPSLSRARPRNTHLALSLSLAVNRRTREFSVRNFFNTARDSK